MSQCPHYVLPIDQGNGGHYCDDSMSTLCIAYRAGQKWTSFRRVNVHTMYCLWSRVTVDIIVMSQCPHYVLPLRQGKSGHQQSNNGSNRYVFVNDDCITSIQITAKLYQLSQWSAGWRQNRTEAVYARDPTGSLQSTWQSKTRNGYSQTFQRAHSAEL